MLIDTLINKYLQNVSLYNSKGTYDFSLEICNDIKNYFKNIVKSTVFWRRLSESDRSSEFCRLVPYRLAKAPFYIFGAGNGNRTRNLTLARLCFTTKLYLQL